MGKQNRQCLICGTKYAYCTSCYEDRHKEPWHILVDNANCKAIFDILTKYHFGELTAEAAQKALAGCNLSMMDCFHESVKTQLETIQEAAKVESPQEAKAKGKGKKSAEPVGE